MFSFYPQPNVTHEDVVEDFNPIAPLIRHALEDVMGINPADHPILVTEPAWNTPANRERMAEIIFEEFNAPAFYIANTSVLNAQVISCYPHTVDNTTIVSPQAKDPRLSLISVIRRPALPQLLTDSYSGKVRLGFISGLDDFSEPHIVQDSCTHPFRR